MTQRRLQPENIFSLDPSVWVEQKDVTARLDLRKPQVDPRSKAQIALWPDVLSASGDRHRSHLIRQAVIDHVHIEGTSKGAERVSKEFGGPVGDDEDIRSWANHGGGLRSAYRVLTTTLARTPGSLSRDMRSSRLDVSVVAAVAVTGAMVGFLGSSQPGLALVLLLGVAVAGFMAVRPVLSGVLSLPALYAYQGIGLGAGLGVSDILIILAALLALPALAHSDELRRIGSLNRAFAAYLLCLLPTIVVNHSLAGDREAVHRIVLILGAFLIGAWLVRERVLERATRFLVCASSIAALICIEASVTTGFSPAEPLHYNKNYVGSLLALTLLLVLCAPEHLDLHRRLRLPISALLILGTLACQSRGAVLGAAAGGLLWLFAPRHGTNVGGRNRVAALVLAVAFTLYAGYSVQQQVSSSNASTNSAGVRLKVEQFTRQLWHTAPVTGVGIRYYSVRDYGPLGQAPNNAIDSELVEGGIVGTIGFVLLHAVTIALLWRRRTSQLGLAALALVVGQLLHGQFDIYWSSGLTPLPFLLAGAALAQGRTGIRDRVG